MLHPVKVTVSFTQTVLPRSKKEASVAVAVAVLSYIPAFATVDRCISTSLLRYS